MLEPQPRAVVDRAPPRHTAGLLAQLDAADVAHRRWAARDLATHPEAAAALGRRLAQEPDRGVRETLFTALAAMPGPEAVEALLPLLRSEDPQLRNGAIEALAAMPQAVGPRIERLLVDTDTDLRIFTVNLLGELRHEQVLPWLEQVLRHEVAVNVVAAAIEVLAETGGPAQVAALRHAQQRFADDPFIGFAADIAMERMASA
jgi:HEAT repeat protein